jgi:hypothetical protein
LVNATTKLAATTSPTSLDILGLERPQRGRVYAGLQCALRYFFHEHFDYSNGALYTVSSGVWETIGPGHDEPQITSKAIVSTSEQIESLACMLSNSYVTGLHFTLPTLVRGIFNKTLVTDSSGGGGCEFTFGDQMILVGTPEGRRWSLALSIPEGWGASNEARIRQRLPDGTLTSNTTFTFTNAIDHTVQLQWKENRDSVLSVDGTAIATNAAATSDMSRIITQKFQLYLDQYGDVDTRIFRDILIVQADQPVLTAPTIASNGTTLTATLSESGCTVYNEAGVTIYSGSSGTINDASISGTTLTATTGTQWYQGETIYISFSAGALKDSDGNDFPAMIFLVTNNSTQTNSVTLANGTFALTGNAVLQQRSVPLSDGSYALTGNTVIRQRSNTLGNGSFALTGNAVLKSRVISLSAGSYVLTGNTVLRSIRKPLATGSYTLTGNTVNVPYGSTVALNTESFVLSGLPVKLRRKSVCASGSFALTGNAILRQRNAVAASGTFALTGNALTYAGELTRGGGMCLFLE